MKKCAVWAGAVGWVGLVGWACAVTARGDEPEMLVPKANADYARIYAERIRAEQAADGRTDNQWQSYVGVLEGCAGYFAAAIETTDAYAAYVAHAEDPSRCHPLDAYFAITGEVRAPELAIEAERVVRAFGRTTLSRNVNWFADPGSEVVFVPPISSDGLLTDWRSACAQPLRVFARVARARIVIAARDGNLEEFREAIRQAAVLGRIASFDGTVGGRAVADGTRISIVRQLLELQLPPGFAAAAVVELRGFPMARWELPYECELLRSWGTVDEAHREGMGRLERGPLWITNVLMQMTFASRATECGLLEATSGRIFAAFDVDAARRSRARGRSLLAFRMMESKWIGWRYPTASLLSLNASGIERQVRQYRMELDGGIAAIAVLAFKDAEGRLPESLSELVPRFLDELPMDWFAEERGLTPLRYVRIDPKADPSGREFKIYSVAGDGVDDGGKEPEGVATESFSVPGKGTDFVVSRQHETPR